MAKLSARGRKEIVRISKKTNPDRTDVEWKRTTYALMSDRKILRKIDTRFKTSPLFPGGEQYSSGWKVYATLKKGMSPEDFVATLPGWEVKWS